MGWPVIGNLLEFADKGQPLLCHELTPKYGKVFMVRMSARSVVFVYASWALRSGF